MMRMVPDSELAPYSVPCGPDRDSHALDVIDVQIKVAVDGGYRLLIEVHADGRLRA